ncbi:MAG TPA: sigma-70 family RNA polymerase sigma factor [Gemmatimonadaceae bacterium]
MERSDNTAQREDETIASTRYPTSARLLAAIHRGDETAIRELFLLYAPLLRDQARRMSIGSHERAEIVTTMLDDVVLHLMEHQIAPRHLTRYLVASLRNRARNWHRDAQRRQATHEHAYSDVGTSRQQIVAECHSEYGVRASHVSDHDTSLPVRPSIAKLAERAVQELTHGETTMLICLGRHMPLREIAEQLGITYGTARVRLHRLRERFRKLTLEHIQALKSNEREELERFFRRAEVTLTRKAVAKQQERTNGQA